MRLTDTIGVDLGGPFWTVAHLRGGLFKGPAASCLRMEGDEAERVAGLKAYISGRGLRRARLALALPPDECFVKVLSLPASGDRELARMLGFETERHLPSEAGEWRWSHAVLKARGASSTVMLTAVKASAADAAARLFEGAGLCPTVVTSGQAALAEALSRSGFMAEDGVCLAASARADGLTFQAFDRATLAYSAESGPGSARQAISFALSFMKEAPRDFIVIDEGPDEDRAEALRAEATRICGRARVFGPVPALSRALGAAYIGNARSAANFVKSAPGLRARRWALGSAAAALVAVVGAGAPVVVRDMGALEKIEREMALLGEDRSRAASLVRELSSFEGDIRVLDEIRGQSPPVFLDTLRTLTELVPEDTYLTGLDYDRDRIIVDGVSSRASGLFMRLSGSGLADGISYDGPVTRGQDGKERFRIRFNRAGGGADGQVKTGS